MVPLTDQFNPSVGPRLKEAREKAGISKGELARRLGIQDGSVSDWETGMASLHNSVFLAPIANVLNITTEWLMEGIEQPTEAPGQVPEATAVPEQPTEAPAIDFTHHCGDCGRGMLEHGVCRVEGLELCFFCAKKRGHAVAVEPDAPGPRETVMVCSRTSGCAVITVPQSTARRGRPPRRTGPVEIILETGVTLVTEDLFPGPAPVSTQITATPPASPVDEWAARMPPEQPPMSTQITATPPALNIPLAPIVDDRTDEWGCEGPAPEPEQPRVPTWQELLEERRDLDARKKAAVELADARLKEIDSLLWPLFTDAQPRLEIEGYLLTRVMPEPKVVVTWDVDKALQSPQGVVLRAMLTPYRQETVKTTNPYLKGTVGKGGSKS